MNRGKHVFAVLALVVGVAARAGGEATVEALRRLAPKADAGVLSLALDAVRCAKTRGVHADGERLAVIDFTRPSLEPRMWVFDLATGRLLYEEHVAHGQGTGDNLARWFSNRPGSHQSSLGLFVTSDTYDGRNGYSLRMRGLEPGINDRAEERAIVLHGADYVDPSTDPRRGQLGRSWGCPAVRDEIARPLIDDLKGGQLLFAYFPDSEWLRQSPFLNCPEE